MQGHVDPFKKFDFQRCTSSCTRPFCPSEARQVPLLSELDEFQLFSFLLPAEDKEKIDQMTESVVAAVKDASAGSAGPRKRAAKPVADSSSKEKASRVAKDREKKKVMDLFG